MYGHLHICIYVNFLHICIYVNFLHICIYVSPFTYMYVSAHKKKCPQRLVGTKMPRRSCGQKSAQKVLVGTKMPRSSCGHTDAQKPLWALCVPRSCYGHFFQNYTTMYKKLFKHMKMLYFLLD